MVWVMDAQQNAQRSRGIGDLAAQIEVELESKKQDLEDAYHEKCKQFDEERAAIAAQYEEARTAYETSFKAELNALTLSHNEKLSGLKNSQAALETSLEESNTQLYAYAAMISNYKMQVEMRCRASLTQTELELQECKKLVSELEGENTILKLGRATRDSEFRNILRRNEQLEAAGVAHLKELTETRRECECLKVKLVNENTARVKAKLLASEHEIERLTETVNAPSAEKDGIVEAYAKQRREDNDAAADRHACLTAELTTLKEANIECSVLGNTKDRQRAESLEADKNDLRQKVASLEALSAERSKELASSREKNAALSNDLHIVNANNTQLAKLRDSHSAQIKTITEENSVLSEKMSLMKKELQDERKISAEFREECIVLSRSSFS